MPADDLGERLAQLAAVLADPPMVHLGAPGGVWGSSRECYEFIARHVDAGKVTLETGLGVSTALFAQWSEQHVCVVGSGDQVDRLRTWATDRSIDLGRVDFAVGTSDEVLPGLRTELVDLMLIDGGHGFPHPTIDWYYGALLLRADGIIVVDDVHLPAVRDFLLPFLDADDRWTSIAGDRKWRAFRKVGDFSVREEWTSQEFLGQPSVAFHNRVKMQLHRQLSKIRR